MRSGNTSPGTLPDHDGTSPLATLTPIEHLSVGRIELAILRGEKIHTSLGASADWRSDLFWNGGRYFEVSPDDPFLHPPGIGRPKFWTALAMPGIDVEDILLHYRWMGHMGHVDAVYFSPVTLEDLRHPESINLHVAYQPGRPRFPVGEFWATVPIPIPEAPTAALCSVGLLGLLSVRRGRGRL